jgi:NAD(P)-dependent dehydrogenase (short-subunit alcohol dehydrogenase family)
VEARAIVTKKLHNKVAVITGAGSGIGRSLARELALQGCRLALSDVNEIGLQETAELCGPCELKTYRLDVADREAIYAHARDVINDFGAVNFVFNNAGVALSASVTEMTDEDFHWVMDIDFWGVVNGTRAFLPHLIASGDGYLVNISSVFGLIGVAKQSAYNAAKFAVRGFTEALRQEMLLEDQPVKVSCVHPGGIRTNIALSARMGKSENVEAQRKGFDKLAVTSPQKAARIIIKGVLKGESRILVGPDAWGIEAINRLLGAAYQPLVARLSRKNLYPEVRAFKNKAS